MAIEYEFKKRPESGTTMPVADGIEWLRMPLPFSLNHINLWLLRDEAGWVIVDTGVGDKDTLEIWPKVFAETMGGEPATHVVATHMHPDHIGCAGFLTDQFDIDLWMTREEYLLCRILVGDTGREAPDEAISFYRAAGFSEEQLQKYKRAFGMYGRMVTALPESYKRMREGDEVRFGDVTWRIITGGGHSPEHASLFDAERNILISGDQLLPKISSIVSVWPTEPRANPLAEWYKGLRHVKSQVPEDVLVLPAHGKPFRGAHDRIDALIKEHDDRLDVLRDICREPMRVIDTFESIFKSDINDGNRIMAVGEALAHLHYLMANGEIEMDTKDDVAWYRAA